MAPETEHERYHAYRVFALLATAFALLFSAVVALLALDQHRVLATAERLQQQTLPELIRYQRLARNLDHLRHEGDVVFSALTEESRQQSLYVVMLISSHPGIVEYPAAAELARDTEAFLVDTGRLAAQEPAQLKRRYPDWQRLSMRISLLVDDLSVQGANMATIDLTEMAEAMRLARFKLMGATALVGGFLVLLLMLFRRHLIGPLQRIDHTLSSLEIDRPAPEFPAARLTEIHNVEAAIKRLHALLLSNETARVELERLATRDDLTGLINRRHFMLVAASELRRAQRYGRPIVVALGDLDAFKRLNDTHGHGAGDLALRIFAGLLTESLRQSDLACRYGGEEFAFLFPESTVEQAQALLERFRQRFAAEDIWLPDGSPGRLTLSIGLVDASHCSLDAALQQADHALYDAKRLGRNRVVVFAEAQ